MAFNAFLVGAGISTTNDSGVWLKRSSQPLSLILREGDPAVGVAGALFGSFRNPTAKPSLSTGAKIFFRNRLSGIGVDELNSESLWTRDGDGQLTLVARAGSLAPDVPADIFFITFSNLAINNFGRIAFQAAFAGPSPETAGGVGIWAEDFDGALRLLVKTGDAIDVADGNGGENQRTILSLAFRGSESQGSTQSGFNDRGELAFWAFLDDGSQGLFVSNAVAIPEAGAVILAMQAAGGFLLVLSGAMGAGRAGGRWLFASNA